VVEVFTGSGIVQGILKTGLAIHGAFFYAGLGITGLAKVIPATLGGVSRLAERAAYAVSGTAALGAAGEKAGAGLLSTAAGAETAAGMPWGWILTAAAGLGVLVYWLMSAKSATQQWSDEMQQALQNAPIQAGLGMIVTDLAAVDTHISSTVGLMQEMNRTGQEWVDRGGRGTGVIKVQSQAYRDQRSTLIQLISSQHQLIDEATLYQRRVGQLATTYGGTTAAQGLLVASGITTQQMLDKSASTWAEIRVQIAGTRKAYELMGQTGGALGNDLQVLNAQAQDQYTAMQKLNQAWQQWAQNMTGTQTSLDTFLQAFPQLNKDWQSGKVNIDSLSQAGLTLNSAFEAQLGNANSLIATWRTAGVANNFVHPGCQGRHRPDAEIRQGQSGSHRPACGPGAGSRVRRAGFHAETGRVAGEHSRRHSEPEDHHKPGDHPGSPAVHIHARPGQLHRRAAHRGHQQGDPGLLRSAAGRTEVRADHRRR
jgi:uncharacterized protein YoxC